MKTNKNNNLVLKNFSPLKEGITSLIISSFFINVLSLAIPLTLMQVYDRILINKSLGTLTWLVTGCGVAIFLDSILRMSRATISNWGSARFEHNAGSAVFKNVLDSRIEDFEAEGAGIHLDRFNAVTTVAIEVVALTSISS